MGCAPHFVLRVCIVFMPRLFAAAFLTGVVAVVSAGPAVVATAGTPNPSLKRGRCCVYILSTFATPSITTSTSFCFLCRGELRSDGGQLLVCLCQLSSEVGYCSGESCICAAICCSGSGEAFNCLGNFVFMCNVTETNVVCLMEWALSCDGAFP